MEIKLERTKNAKRNIAFGVVNKLVTILFPFAIRTVIIKEIGADYLGLTSLFTSILQVLNITELGFSSAVIYSMYKPIADGDNETLCAILNFYRKIYFFIGLIILAIGIVVLPFLPKLIKGDTPNDINIYILYLIYLANSVVSYLLFAYKNSLISAYQRNDVISNINTIVHIFAYSAQIVVIVLTHNFYLYALVLFVASVSMSISTEICSRRMFPDIICKGTLSKGIKVEINQKVKGLLVNKLCQTSRNSFDSIFVSAFLGLTATAIYNNYYYIMNAVTMFFGVVATSILAGVGNSIVTEGQQKNYADMKKFNFIYMWLGGWSTICLLCLYQPFTEIFFGKDMLFPFPVVVLFCVYFYVLKMGDIRSVYSDAKGLWWENRYRAILESVTNLVLNFVLGKFFGVYGIIIATLISLFFVNFIWGSSIIYKYYFTEIRISEYYLLHLFYAVVTFGSCAATLFVCSILNVAGVTGLLLRFLICMILPNILYFLCYFRTPMFLEAKKFVMASVKRR